MSSQYSTPQDQQYSQHEHNNLHSSQTSLSYPTINDTLPLNQSIPSWPTHSPQMNALGGGGGVGAASVAEEEENNQVVLHSTPSNSVISHHPSLSVSQQPQEYVYDDADDGSEVEIEPAPIHQHHQQQYLQQPRLAQPQPLQPYQPPIIVSPLVNDTPMQQPQQPEQVIAAPAATTHSSYPQRDVRVTYDADGNMIQEQVINIPAANDAVETRENSAVILHEASTAENSQIGNGQQLAGAGANNALDFQDDALGPIALNTNNHSAYDPASVTRGYGTGTATATTRNSFIGDEELGMNMKAAGATTAYSNLPVIRTSSTIPKPLADQRPLSQTASASQLILYTYRPYATFVFTLVWCILFLVEFGVYKWKLEDTYINPSLGVSYGQLEQLGALAPYKVFGRRHASYGADSTGYKEGYRIITSLLWHSGIIHIIPNLCAFAWLAHYIEATYGAWRLCAIVAVSGIYGTIFSLLFSTELLVVSASTCTFGLIGARVVDLCLYHSWYRMQDCIMDSCLLLLTTAIGVVIGLLPLIDNWAHLGGLLMGTLVGIVLFTGNFRSPPEMNNADAPGTVIQLDTEVGNYVRVRWFTLALTVIVYLVTILLVFVYIQDYVDHAHAITSPDQRQDVWCQGCTKFQCLDTSAWTCRPEKYYN